MKKLEWNVTVKPTNYTFIRGLFKIQHVLV